MTIERAAKAIVENCPIAIKLEQARWHARSALNAIADPTTEMILAAYGAWDKFGEDAVMGPEEAFAIWRAMHKAMMNS